ncbi:MAG: sugar phosphate isomerase/epimerase family protein [Candidatus Sumerlaeia bacterium]
MAYMDKLGIQSFCFRNFLPIDELIGAMQKAGLSNVEIWPKHIAFDHDPAEVNAKVNALKGAGISISSYGALQIKKGDESVRKHLEYCKKLGISAVTTMIAQDAIEFADEMAQETGVNLALHNHGRKDPHGPADVIKDIFSRTSERIGLCLDAAWALDSGDDPHEMVTVFADRLMGVHLKDFVFDDEGNHKDVIIGTGGLDLPRFIKLLQTHNFDGYISIEYEGNPEDPFDEIIACIDQMKAID